MPDALRTQMLLALAGGAQIVVPPAPPVVQPQTQTETRTRDQASILLIHDTADLAVQTRESKHQWRWIYSAGIPSRAVEEWYQMPPHSRLLDPAVKVIVPTGNQGLRELTGQKSVAQCRGSVYQWQGKWVIPALSPLVVKGTLKTWERRCYLDWQRIASFLQSDLPCLPQPVCVTSPTLADVEWLQHDMEKTGYLSLDIETLPSEGKMLCVGFSACPQRALCLEWTPEWLPVIKELCQSNTIKILWNHSYDLFWLATESIPVVGRVLDGMLLLHTLMPTDNVGLAYAASTESLYPFWKDQCVRGDVEVLTPVGWERLDTLDDMATIAQWNQETRAVTWTVAHKVEQAFSGTGVRIRSKQHNCFYTPMHRLPEEQHWQGKVYKRTRRAHEALHLRQWNLMTAGSWASGTQRFPWPRMLAAIQADAKLGKYYASFTLKKTRKIRRLLELCAAENVDCKEYTHKLPDGYRSFRVSGKGVEIISQLMGSGNAKCFGSWLLQFDVATLRTIVEETEFWDGSRLRSGTAFTFGSIKRENVEWLATIASLSGHATHVRSDINRGFSKGAGKLYWTVSVKQRPWTSIQSNYHVTQEDYCGPVYCVTVPDGFFLARTNGQIFVSGNSKDSDDKSYEENWEQFKRYNCLDSLVALEVTLKLQERVIAEGLWDFYTNHYEALYAPVLDVMLKGVEIDHTVRKALLKTYQAEAIKHRDALAAFNGGEPLFTLTTQRDQRIFQQLREGKNPYDSVNPARREKETAEVTSSINRIQSRTVSGVKLKHLLYTLHHVPPQLRRRAAGEETESVDIFALRQIANDYRHDPDISAICDHALKHTRFQKLSTFLTDNRYDEDGRMRFTLKFLTEIGRLASSASPRGRKVNSQNIPREKDVRSLILPEKGHVCLQADLSCAESRVCFVLTRDSELVELARKPSAEYDQHRHVGVIVGMAPTFDETPENMLVLTKDQRQVAKVIGHASQRASQAFTISQTLLRNNQRNQEGNLFSEAECEAALTRYHKRFPAIRYWHARVRSQVRRHRMLVNTWGRRWPVPYDYFSDELWRRAYSVSLASEIADLLNQWGFRAVHEFIQLHRLQSRVMLQEHDGLVLSCPIDEVYDIATFLRASLEQERDYFGISLSIPVEFQVGRAWGSGEEWKTLPDRREMEDVARAALYGNGSGAGPGTSCERLAGSASSAGTSLVGL